MHGRVALRMRMRGCSAIAKRLLAIASAKVQYQPVSSEAVAPFATRTVLLRQVSCHWQTQVSIYSLNDKFTRDKYASNIGSGLETSIAESNCEPYL